MAIKANRIIRVFVIALVCIATSVFLYLLVNNFQFTRGVVIQVHFNSIGDLNTGAWVRKAGLKIGSVTQLKPAEDEKTVIATLTFQPGQIVRQDDKFSLIAKGILGDMYIEVNPGPKDSPKVESGFLFEGQPSFSLNDILGGSGADLIGDLTGSIKAIADLLLRNQAALDATIKDIQITAANARVISEEVAKTSRELPRATEEVLASLDKLSNSVNELTEATDVVVGQLKGSISTGASDLSVSLKSIKEATSQIQTMVDQLSTKDSVISTLSSAETSRSVSETLSNLQEMSRALLKATQDTQTIIEGVKEILGPSN